MEDDLSKAKKRGSGTIEQNVFVSISHIHYYSVSAIHFGIEDDVHGFGMNVAWPGVVAVTTTTTIPKKKTPPNAKHTQHYNT